MGELLPRVLGELVDRASHGYARWAEQVAATGYCVHPVRLQGRVGRADQGRVRSAPCTRPNQGRTPPSQGLREPAGVGVSSCSATYQADPSFQLLAAGLRGGGVSYETVAHHPRLFVTFTAPSFGRVRFPEGPGAAGVPCHPYRQGQLSAWTAEWAAGSATTDDPRLGEPLCARATRPARGCCGILAGRLVWTTIYVYQALAQLASVTEAELRQAVRISFAKVAQYQKRGAVHFRAIIRLDAATDCACPACVAPPPARFTADLLEAAVRQAAASVAVPCPVVDEARA